MKKFWVSNGIYIRQMFRDVLRKHGMSGEWAGMKYIPRTLDVYSKERMDSQWAQGVQIDYLLTEGATATFPIMLTQQSWLRGDQEPHEDPEVLRVLEERLIQEVAAVETEIKKIGERLVAVDSLLADAIVLTERDCAVLGPDWRRYEGMGGRFPLGAGETEDARGEGEPYTLGQTGGAYLHQLTVPEMPAHRHQHRDRWLDNRRRGPQRGDDDDVERHHNNDNHSTSIEGGNEPHNNMPPYLVMNFCHKGP